MNFAQVLQRMRGEPFNEAAMHVLELTFRNTYPYAQIDVFPPNVRATTVNYTCMTCGNKLRNVTELKWLKSKKEWIPRKSKANLYPAAVCMVCDPSKIQPLVVSQAVS